MTDRELMQQALSTLEGWANHGNWVWPDSALEQAKRNTTEAITALRERLAQPEQNHPEDDLDMVKARQIAHEYAQPHSGIDAGNLYWALHVALRRLDHINHIGSTNEMVTEQPQPEQEPVQHTKKYVTEQRPVGEIVQAFADLTAVSIPVMPPVGTKLYTAPPRREWVGLTDEEHMVLYAKADKGLHEWAYAIEAKLKEKNQCR